MNEKQTIEDLNADAASDINDLKAYRKRKLITSSVRWTLTIVLYYSFWHIDWVRWSLIIVAPLILYNLYMIIFGLDKVLTKFEDLQERIKK